MIKCAANEAVCAGADTVVVVQSLCAEEVPVVATQVINQVQM